MSLIGTGPSLPGVKMPSLSTFLNDFWWGDAIRPHHFTSGVILSSTVDSGNTPTTTLRAGLIMGFNPSTKKWSIWDPDATNGTQFAAGVLKNTVSTLDVQGSAEDKFVGWIVTSGRIQSSRLIVPGASTPSIIGHQYEYLLRRQLSKNFMLDDAQYNPVLFPGDLIEVRAANYTVTYQDNGKLFITTGATGAVTFTLPANPYKGLIYDFVAGADQNLIVAAATADTIVTDGDLAADSVQFSTASHIIGSRVRLEGLGGTGANGRWLATNLGSTTMTVNT